MKRRSLLLAIGSTPLWAQTQRQQSVPVYRCGSDGRQLSDRPCAPGVAGSGVGFDQPSERDAQAARDRAQQQSREADALRQAREHREAQPSPPPQRLNAPLAPSAPASSPKPKPHKRLTRQPAKRRRQPAR